MVMVRSITIIALLLLWQPFTLHGQVSAKHNLHFHALPRQWDEGIPLGNGMLGALVWNRDGVLRMALDRADLWDLRKIKEFDSPNFRFSWVESQLKKKDYDPVHRLLDIPYDRDAVPTKIPGAAIEFQGISCKDISDVTLDLGTALCRIRWKNGATMETFVHATGNYGWFTLTGFGKSVKPYISMPPYAAKTNAKVKGDSGAGGNDLRRLGYKPGTIRQSTNDITYHQDCADGTSYEVWVAWKQTDSKTITGCWTITPSKPYSLYQIRKKLKIADVTAKKYRQEEASHEAWWREFWNKSYVSLPDSILEVQWYRELYKFGSASRKGAPPITLQAVWTADNRKLPPWKGDFHNDLNTQLSYWPSYSANHLGEAEAFTDWLWLCKPVAEKYTKTYFAVKGLNFPGVATLTGEPMGGWIQYSLGPTVSAWLAQHFFLQWKYSMDTAFLKDRAYPWIRQTAEYLENISKKDSHGKRKLPLSSSPEINDNSPSAWFHETTNFDLSLIRWVYGTAAGMAGTLGYREDSVKWSSIEQEWPDLAISDEDNGLLVAPGIPLKESHRHFSHLMAIHPLGLLDWNNGPFDTRIINSSLAHLEKLGSDNWCGYSWAWLGSLYARAHMGTKAANALKTFATCFCSPNSFHLNGDQSGTGKSKMTYRPFTLEGNFAFAEGIQEMLLQSQNGRIQIFPAIPASWTNVSFHNLRTEGAFLVSAERKDGELSRLEIISEKGGTVNLINPFLRGDYEVEGIQLPPDALSKLMIRIDTKPGMKIVFHLRD